MKENNRNKNIRAGMNTIAGAIPFFGGLISAAAGVWSENEQEKFNIFVKNWLMMLEEEMKEKAKTMEEVLARLDMKDEKINERISSKSYQSILKKTFRNWSNIDTDEKRIMIRNILSNSATTELTSDDVVKMFIDWIDKLSELHIKTISAIYNSNGITRGEIWRKMGKEPVRENSADADLFKLIIRELNLGGIIRQHREVDMYGNFIKKTSSKKNSITSNTYTSAFDNDECYELTSLGNQFVHYAMTDIPQKLEYKSAIQ